jgi:peptidoglycan/xylan/chitin deacetylase (PgdA/CDA1 family)
LWHKSRNEKNIYLTFDDGPVPGITEFVLSELEEFGAKATFFAVGENIEKHQDIFHKIIERGHSIGNHTFNHLNGRKVPADYYLQNVEKCQAAINRERYHRIHKLFRPPFGMIKRSAAGRIKNNYTIVMWDVLSGDFDKHLSPEKSLTKSINAIQNGSIVVFHDSFKSQQTLKFVLPRFLSHLAENHYTCKPL